MSNFSFFDIGSASPFEPGQTEESNEARALTAYTLELVVETNGRKKTEFLTLPIAPQSLDIREPARMGVQQTLAGKYVEEWGAGYKTINMGGHTGFEVKRAVAGTAPMDGYQAWRELVRFFRTYYAIAEANALTKGAAELTKAKLILHIWEEDEHWQVVPNGPEALMRQRNSQSPLLFHFSLSFCVVGAADVSPEADQLKDFLLLGPSPFDIMGDLLGDAGLLGDLAGAITGMANTITAVANGITNVVKTAKNIVAGVLAPFKGIIMAIAKVQRAIRSAINAARKAVRDAAQLIRMSRLMLCAFKKLGSLGRFLGGLLDPIAREWALLQQAMNRC